MALVAGLLPPCLLAWRLAHFPGWDLTDESVGLGYWQHLHQGLRPSWQLMHGEAYRALMGLALRADAWDPAALRAASLAIYAATLGALFLLGRRLLGPSTAWAAVAVAGAAALPAIQMGSLLSPQWQPLAWGGLAWAALSLRRPWQSLAWGAACGIMLMDYEGWPLGLPGLAALLLLVPAPAARWKNRATWAALGFAVVAGWALWRGAPQLAVYVGQRKAYSVPSGGGQAWSYLAVHLKEFFLGGGSALPTQGVPLGAAQFPLWALAPLVLGLLLSLGRRVTAPRGAIPALLLSAACPLLAFSAHAPAVPSERVLTAWPALCLLAGIGLAWAWQWRRAAAWVVVGLTLSGGAWEARAYIRGLEALGPRFYGNSGAWLTAARGLRQGPAPELLWQLDSHDRGDLALTFNAPLAATATTNVVAVIPWQCAPSLDRSMGRWSVYPGGEGQAPVLICWPLPPQASALREAHAALKAFWDLHPDGAVYADLVQATHAPIANPWVRDALWEARFQAARRQGHTEPAEGDQALSLGLLRVDPLIRQARDQFQSDPAKAEWLLWHAVARDPRRREAWRGLRQLLNHADRQKDLLLLDKKIDQLTLPTYEPFWLQE